MAVTSHKLSLRRLVFFLCLIPTLFYGQAACVHSKGIQFVLDSYLGSLGACDCEKASSYLIDFPSCNTDPYELEFEDNFNTTVFDTSLWQLQPSAQGALKDNLWIEYNSLDNVSVANGICSITARKEKVMRRAVNWKEDNEILRDGSPNLRSYEYTSSCIWTKKSFFHGKIEARCRMPKANGFWPAFWMFGGERQNEIDIFDNYGGYKRFVTSIGHEFEGNRKANGCAASYSDFDFSDWHTFTCIFEADKIVIQIDGRTIRVVHRILTVTGLPVNCNDNIAAGSYMQLKAYPIEKMHIIFGFGVVSPEAKGSFEPMNSSTPFPGSLEIDYLKVWKRVPNQINLFPNPASTTLTIKSDQAPILSVSVFNTMGQILSSEVVNSNHHQVDIEKLASGIYYIKIAYDGGSSTKKFIKAD